MYIYFSHVHDTPCWFETGTCHLLVTVLQHVYLKTNTSMPRVHLVDGYL